MLDVAAGVAQLLVGQRPGVPAREARRLGQADPQHVVEQAVVAGLRGEAREARGDLGVEDVGEGGLPLAPQDRHVLAPGVQDDLDRRIGEHLGERRRVKAPDERIEHLHVLSDHDLHEAEQRAVAALRHELGVQAETAVLVRGVGEALDVRLRHLDHRATLSAPTGRERAND